MQLPILTPRLYKPPGNPRIDWSNAPRGLKALYLCQDTRVTELVRGIKPTAGVGTPVLTGTSRGLGFGNGSQSALNVNVPFSAAPSTGTLEALLWVPASGYTDGMICGFTNSAYNNGNHTFQLIIRTATGGLAFYTYDGTTLRFALGAAISGYAGTFLHLVGTCTTSLNSLYVNGVLVGTQATSGGSQSLTTPLFNMGASTDPDGNNNNVTSCPILYSLYSSAVFTAAEVAARYENPFGFLTWPDDELLATVTPPSSSAGIITHVQGKTSTSSVGSTVTTQSITLGKTVGNGNMICGMWSGYSGSGSFSVTDDKSNIYTVITNATQSADIVWIFYCNNITNAPTTITASWTSTGYTYVVGIVDEWSGVTGLDQSGIGHNSSGAPTSSSVTTNYNSELIYISALVFNSPTLTVGSGYHLLEQATTGTTIASEYQLQTSAGSVSGSFGGSTVNAYLAGIMTFSGLTPVVDPNASSWGYNINGSGVASAVTVSTNYGNGICLVALITNADTLPHAQCNGIIGSGMTFAKRAGVQPGAETAYTEVWWAQIPSAGLSSVSITPSYSGGVSYNVMEVVCVSAGGLTVAFDSAGVQTSGAGAATFTSQNGYDFVYAWSRQSSTSNPGNGSGWTSVIPSYTLNTYSILEYQDINIKSTGTYTGTTSTSAGDISSGIVDALVVAVTPIPLLTATGAAIISAAGSLIPSVNIPNTGASVAASAGSSIANVQIPQPGGGHIAAAAGESLAIKPNVTGASTTATADAEIVADQIPQIGGGTVAAAAAETLAIKPNVSGATTTATAGTSVVADLFTVSGAALSSGTSSLSLQVSITDTGVSVVASAGISSGSNKINNIGALATTAASSPIVSVSFLDVGAASVLSAGSIIDDSTITSNAALTTGYAGNITPKIIVLLSGASVLSAAGTPDISAGGSDEVSITGAGILSAASSPHITIQSVVSSGAAAASVGSIIPSIGAVSGCSVASAASNLQLALQAYSVGAITTTSAGTINTIAIQEVLAGASSITSAGSPIISIGFYNTGVEAFANVGTVKITDLDTVTGVSASCGAGSTYIDVAVQNVSGGATSSAAGLTQIQAALYGAEEDASAGVITFPALPLGVMFKAYAGIPTLAILTDLGLIEMGIATSKGVVTATSMSAIVSLTSSNAVVNKG